jgi:hypothetical protein
MLRASPNPMTSFEAPKAGDPIRMQGDKLEWYEVYAGEKSKKRKK